MRVAIDTGGTFTDCVFMREDRLEVLKAFSTPANPAGAVLSALARIAPGAPPGLRHGTTVGTNTLLERTGARVAFVTTEGFADTLAIGRQTRGKLYDWFQAAPDCLVPAERRFGVGERTSAGGERLLVPTEEVLCALAERVRASGAESIALSLLSLSRNRQTNARLPKR